MLLLSKTTFGLHSTAIDVVLSKEQKITKIKNIL
jgi:hypothetical protein